MRHDENSKKAVKKLKVRFMEVMDERNKNENWIKNAYDSKTEEINYAELKETAKNPKRFREAKEKNLQISIIKPLNKLKTLVKKYLELCLCSQKT